MSTRKNPRRTQVLFVTLALLTRVPGLETCWRDHFSGKHIVWLLSWPVHCLVSEVSPQNTQTSVAKNPPGRHNLHAKRRGPVRMFRRKIGTVVEESTRRTQVSLAGILNLGAPPVSLYYYYYYDCDYYYFTVVGPESENMVLCCPDLHHVKLEYNVTAVARSECIQRAHCECKLGAWLTAIPTDFVQPV